MGEATRMTAAKDPDPTTEVECSQRLQTAHKSPEAQLRGCERSGGVWREKSMVAAAAEVFSCRSTRPAGTGCVGSGGRLCLSLDRDTIGYHDQDSARTCKEGVQRPASHPQAAVAVV